MLQSNQIINENSYPIIKSSAIDSQGKVRILAFDVDFSNKETTAQEDILLVKLPKVCSRIIQFGITSAEGIDTDTFDLVLVDSIYNSISNTYEIVASNNIKTGISLSNSGGAVLNINKLIEPHTDINVERYINLKSSIAFTKENILNGYVLYIMD